MLLPNGKSATELAARASAYGEFFEPETLGADMQDHAPPPLALTQ